MNSTILLIVAIVSVFIGYAGGAIITARQTGKKSPKEEIKSQAPSQAEPPEPVSPVRPLAVDLEPPTARPLDAVSAPPADPNRVDIAVLWRELPHGSLRADMSGRTVRGVKDLSLDQHNLLKAIQQDLSDWLGPLTMASAGAGSAPAPAVSASPASALVDGAAVELSTPRKAKDSAPEAATSASTGLGQKKAGELISEPPVAIPAEKKTPQSIVGQIDEILQAQIKGTPLESRGIRLVESATHGVTVWIGIKAYQGMDTIPDAEINLAIKAAVKEWEARK